MLTADHVDLAYRLLLGRSPDAQESAAWGDGADLDALVDALLAQRGEVSSAAGLTREQVTMAYRLFLGRLPENELVIHQWRTFGGVADLVAAVRSADEFRARRDGGTASRLGGTDQALVDRHRGADYLAPTDLAVTDTAPQRVLLIGECLFDEWVGLLEHATPGLVIDRLLFNHGSVLPAEPPQPFAAYDYQLIQVPLRSILPEQALLRLAADDAEGFQRVLGEAIGRLHVFLDAALAWSDRIPAFVFNYLVPQVSGLGRLLPRHDPRNPRAMIVALNDALDRRIAGRPNSHVLDLDGVAAAFGRRFVQDDMVWLTSHGGVLSDFDYPHDRERLEPVGPVSDHYAIDLAGFMRLAWRESVAMWRTLTGVDAVKLVIVDLDDTLWRGVIAESDRVDPASMEGWPLGMLEALALLKRRGVLLAIVSKNDEARIRDLWGHLAGQWLSLDDFASVKINWRPKGDNVSAVLAETNLLPGNALFVDDNPVERAHVRAAVAGIRTLDAPHYYWRRILLGAPETQVRAISAESARRTELIQAGIQRDQAQVELTREAFLESLDLKVEVAPIGGSNHPDFGRAFELINKTNQFNTTGRRWTHAEAEEFLANGGCWWRFSAQDRFTRYGLIGVVAVSGDTVEQMVMSCRVFGLDVEFAVLGTLLPPLLAATGGRMEGRIVDTAANAPSRGIFDCCGWQLEGEGLWRGSSAPEAPPHVAVEQLNGRG
jgi:FkbH-like protein